MDSARVSLTNRPEHHGFWGTALAWSGSAGPKVFWRVVIFVIYSTVITYEFSGNPKLNLDLGIFEISGAALGILLVLRTNSGYDRWWEARKLWGGIVNQSRNLVISAVSYGPKDLEWQNDFRKWAITFSHVVRRSLRGQRDLPELQGLLTEKEGLQVKQSFHMPSYVIQQLASLLMLARSRDQLDGFGFIQVDRERALLMDHVGACERILKTPIPIGFAIIIRGFMVFFFALVPFVMIPKVGWLTPILMFIVAYPLLSLDQIGVELQNPFDSQNLSHLPLDEITDTIQTHLKSYF